MISSFLHKGLAELFELGATAKISAEFHRRLLERLDALDAAQEPGDLNVPGYKFHSLKGDYAGRYAISVNGPWRLTFGFEDGNAIKVDFEQYH